MSGSRSTWLRSCIRDNSRRMMRHMLMLLWLLHSVLATANHSRHAHLLLLISYTHSRFLHRLVVMSTRLLRRCLRSRCRRRSGWIRAAGCDWRRVYYVHWLVRHVLALSAAVYKHRCGCCCWYSSWTRIDRGWLTWRCLVLGWWVECYWRYVVYY